MNTLLPGSRGSSWTQVGAALALPALATGVALVLPGAGLVTATSLHLFAVVLAALLGGLRGGVGAAGVSFVTLNFFFTPPRHTFRVSDAEDLVALVVFLAVSVVVGTLVARATSERDRAERREREGRLLAEVANHLTGREGVGPGLEAVATTVVEAFGLDVCELDAMIDGEPLRARVGPGLGSGPEAGSAQVGMARFELPGLGGSLGSLVAVRPQGADPLGAGDRRLLRAVASQVGLALERVGLDAEVRRAVLDAEASRHRASLFSSVTHDLRTPLASIKAAATTLVEAGVDEDPARRRDLLETVIEETDRLNRLVGNIMDVARIRSGALSLELQVVPVEEVVDATLARLRPQLARFRVRTIMRPGLPLVTVDPVQIDQVLSNLLENAVRFSSPGAEIAVSAALWQGRVVVRVADHGPGIPPEERDRVFDEFRRGAPPEGPGGTGLGLSIARAIVAAHGGRIWIEGTPGGGTTVAFELPTSSLDREPERAEGG